MALLQHTKTFDRTGVCSAFQRVLSALESGIMNDLWGLPSSLILDHHSPIWGYSHKQLPGLRRWDLINKFSPDSPTLRLFIDDKRRVSHGHIDIGEYDDRGLPHPKTRQILNEFFKLLENCNRLKYQTRIHGGNFHQGKTVVSCNGYECPFEPNPDHDHRRVIDFVVSNKNVIEFI